MSLKLSYTTKDGVTHPDAYFYMYRIDDINLRSKRFSCWILVFHDDTTLDSQPIDQFKIEVKEQAQLKANGDPYDIDSFDDFLSINPNNPNDSNIKPFKAVQDWLKTQTDLNGVDFTQAIEV